MAIVSKRGLFGIRWKWFFWALIGGVALLFMPQIKTWCQNAWNWFKSTKMYGSVKNQLQKDKPTDQINVTGDVTPLNTKL